MAAPDTLFQLPCLSVAHGDTSATPTTVPLLTLAEDAEGGAWAMHQAAGSVLNDPHATANDAAPQPAQHTRVDDAGSDDWLCC